MWSGATSCMRCGEISLNVGLRISRIFARRLRAALLELGTTPRPIYRAF